MSGEGLFRVFAFLFGAILGSFANACIHRLPRGLSLTRARSMCTRCGAKIAFYDNIPVASYLFLRGRCRSCGAPFGVRYFLVELLMGLVALWIYGAMGPSVRAVYLLLLVTALVIVSAVDFAHRIIPDAISLSGTAVGLLAAALCSWLGVDWWVTFGGALKGAAVGVALLWGVGWVYEKVTGREGIGMGDVKLLALFGAHAGVMGVFTSLFYGSLLGVIPGLAAVVFCGKDRTYPIPFGPFLSAGFLIYLAYGDAAIGRPVDWLLGLAGQTW